VKGPFTTEALLLRSTDKGEDDRAVVLLTPEQGRLTALAKHARGSKRRFGAALQPFCLFEAALRPRGGGLAFLESVTALEFPLGSAPGFDAMAAAWLFLDLADALCTAGTSQPAYFELLLGGLRRLGRGSESAASVRISVLWGSLELAGWAPDLDACAGCGSKGPWKGLSLDPARGLLCPSCRPAGTMSFAGDFLALWRSAAQGQPMADAPAEAEQALLRWAEFHAGRAFPSAALALPPATAPPLSLPKGTP
jgi:DNA repair protein RecO (recombination protein O)